MTKTISAFFLASALLAVGCNRGYLSADAMETGEIGPRHCQSNCEELGLEMGAFVLVQHGYAGCVCQPRRSSGSADLSGGVAVNAGAVMAMAEAERRAAAQQQQQQN